MSEARLIDGDHGEAFSVVVPQLWNSLPGEVRLAPWLDVFERGVKKLV